MDEATAGTSAGQMSQASIRGTVEGWSPELVGCTSRQIFNVSCVDVLYVCVCVDIFIDEQTIHMWHDKLVHHFPVALLENTVLALKRFIFLLCKGPITAKSK